MNRVIQLGVVLSCFYGAAAQAALIVGQQQFNGGDVLPSPIAAVAGDLLETSVASVSGENAGALVRNGVTGTAHQTTGTGPAVTWGAGNATTTYNLDISVNTLGYDISEIRLFSGWLDGRAGQSYELLYSLVGNGTFTSLGTVSALQSNGSLLTRTYDSLSAAILTGVDAIQFTQIDNNIGGGIIVGQGTVFREFDVIGVATVPEPSSLAMLLFGSIGLWLMRRSKSR